MSTAAARPADPPAPDRRCAARALIEGRIAMLTRLAEIGMEIAEAAGRAARSQAEGGGADGFDPGLTFSRAARAVRLTLALQSRLADALAALDRAEALARTTEAARRRNRIHRHIERTAEAEGCDADEVERLSSDAWERLTDEDDADLLDLPIDEAVARICRDLGLAPDAYVAAFADPADSAPADSAPPGPARPQDPVPAWPPPDLRPAPPDLRPAPAASG